MSSRSRWVFPSLDERKVQDLAAAINRPTEIAQVLCGRGLDHPKASQEFLNQSLSDLKSPYDLKGVKEASETIATAILNQECIFVHGDFDADGITATALFDIFLSRVEARFVSFVPNRLTQGHGISQMSMDLALEKETKLFITCDCGSSDLDQIQYLQDHGVKVIITDHHQIPSGFSSSTLLVNPQNQLQGQPWRELSGVGVVFVVLMAVRKALRDAGHFAKVDEPNLKELLDIVALGTIADMAPLTGQNRTLVLGGLKQLENTCSLGILAMKEKSGIVDKSVMDSSDVGFRLAPRINAAARLGFSDQALELLRSQDLTKVHAISESMEKWNQERKEIADQMLSLAQRDIDMQLRNQNHCLWIASQEFHPGLIGLVAQKLAKAHDKPAFVFTFEGDQAKGSARMPQGHVHLVHAMEACSQHLQQFGGHREAGGCSLKKNDLEAFHRDFSNYIALHQGSFSSKIHIDATLRFEYIHDQFLTYLHQLGPFGMGNPEPVFHARVKILGKAFEVGANHLKARLSDSSGATLGSMGFGMWKTYCEWGHPEEMEILFFPEYNVYRGRREIYLRLLDLRV
ncbi:MAG: single-stranded-DNA-specific exonuclease RecJ [Bdellovibrionales bacterium]|nr:single-stranded-DNA-specific exonuclease RecJ [Bdellovibrionales bacterium]